MPLEIERKYLIDAKANDLIRQHAKTRGAKIKQGYLSVGNPEIRLRSSTYYTPNNKMTVKTDGGLVRKEVEFFILDAVAEELWGIIGDMLLQKTRYFTEDGWEFDIFEDRDLTLAEIELCSETQEITVPEWLLPYIIREVTEESAYKNKNLVQRK